MAGKSLGKNILSLATLHLARQKLQNYRAKIGRKEKIPNLDSSLTALCLIL